MLDRAVLKNTNQETVVKVYGDGAVVMELDDPSWTASTQEYVSDPKVNLITAIWVGEANSTVTISRRDNLIEEGDPGDYKVILTAPGYQPQTFDFQGQGFVDESFNGGNIKVDIAGEACIYLTFRKAQGWATKIEGATFGSYDDPTQVGS